MIMPHIVKLSHHLHESIILALGNRPGSIFNETFHDTSFPNNLLTVMPQEGADLALHCSSSGKIILAELSENELQDYIDNKDLERYTPNTITDINILKNNLVMIKKEGVAFDDEELALGVRGVACPLRNSEGLLLHA